MLRAMFDKGKATIALTEAQKRQAEKFTALLAEIGGIPAFKPKTDAAIAAIKSVMDEIGPAK